MKARLIKKDAITRAPRRKSKSATKPARLEPKPAVRPRAAFAALFAKGEK